MAKAYTKAGIIADARQSGRYSSTDVTISLTAVSDCSVGSPYLTACQDALALIEKLEPFDSDVGFKEACQEAHESVNDLDAEKERLMLILSSARSYVPDFIELYREVAKATPLSIYVWLRAYLWPHSRVSLTGYGLKTSDMGSLSRYKDLSWLRAMDAPSVNFSLESLYAAGLPRFDIFNSDAAIDDVCAFLIGKPYTVQGRRAPKAIEIAGYLISEP